jgi:putative flippase GtrA
MRLVGTGSASEIAYVLRFLAVGVLNTCVGLGSIFAFKYFLGLGDAPANFCGYLIGLTNSFFWNRRWTFSHSGRIGIAAARFLLVFVVAYAVNLAVALICIHLLGVNAYLAHAIATAPYTVIFYLGSRYFAFSPRGDAHPDGSTGATPAQEAPP